MTLVTSSYRKLVLLPSLTLHPVDRMTSESDLIIIGGGIVGLATAYRFLERFPGKTVTVLEKEAAVARHQTGRNSGVMHTGIYYRPGSLKAQNCRAGKLAMEEFCTRENIPFILCGKIIVAVEQSELTRMETLLERGPANGVVCHRIGPEQIRELEPHCVGLAGIHIPEAGVVDYGQVAKRLADIVNEKGSRVVTSAGRPPSAATMALALPAAARLSKPPPASSPPNKSSTAPASTATASPGSAA